MRKIWSAANVKVYGGGVAEEGFLRALSDLIGDYSYINVSVSTGKSGPSRSRQESKERIFDGYPDVTLELVNNHLFDGQLQLLEYIPTVLDAPPGADG